MKCTTALFAFMISISMSFPFCQLALAESNQLSAQLGIRTRIASVDDGQDATDNALAWTTRVSSYLQIAKLLGSDRLSAKIDMINVSALVRDYNSTSKGGNQHKEYAAVIDPPGTKVSQAYVTVQALDWLTLNLGRKYVNLDDQRFVGAVDWRQFPQSFGVYEIVAKPLENLTLQLDYVYERIGIKKEFNGLYKEGSIFFFTQYQLIEALTLTAQLIQLQDVHDTTALKLSGKVANLNYALQYASQAKASRRDEADEVEIEAAFLGASLGAKFGSVGIQADLQQLGEAEGDSVTGFSTPLATLHKFEGWSDALLGKAAAGDVNGVKTVSLDLSYAFEEKKGVVKAIYQKFDSVKESLDYGSEINLLYKRNLSEKTMVLLKAALYTAGDDFAEEDVSKYWLMAQTKI